MRPGLDFDSRCRFPAIALYQEHDLSVFEALDGLVVCRKIDLKAGQRGRFGRATIVDSESMAWEMDGATKLHGVGPFWGYNIFLSQTIRVRPNITVSPKPAQIEEIKSEVAKCLRRKDAVTLVLKDYCATIGRAEAHRTVPLIEAASSIPEIIAKLLAMDFRERSRLITTTGPRP
jgi:hypothetical protein